MKQKIILGSGIEIKSGLKNIRFEVGVNIRLGIRLEVRLGMRLKLNGGLD